MKNLRINKKLCAKLTAFTLAASIGFTQMSQSYTTYAYSVPTTNQEYSMGQNLSYKYSINGKNYTITRKMDNSITVVEESTNGTNTLTMDNQGNVVIKMKDNFLPKTERFSINNFNGEKLSINQQEVKDKDLKASMDALENYFNSISFVDSAKAPNYVPGMYDKYKDLSNRYLGQKESQPFVDSTKFTSYASDDTYAKYKEISNQYMADLGKNNLKIEEPLKIKVPEKFTLTKTVYAASPAAVLTPQDVSQIGIAASTVPAALEGLIIAGGAAATTGVLLTAGLFVGAVVLGCVIYQNQVFWVETPARPVTDYSDARFIPMTLEEAQNMGYVDVRAVTAQLEQNLRDDDPNNDYFKAFMVNDGIIVIDFANPMGKEKAAAILSNVILNREHVYTLTATHAADVVKAAGGIPGTSNGRPENIGRAENHAYVQSFRAFDPITKTVNQELLQPNNKQGVYFWHYHFNGKKMINGQINDKHTWFGEPTVRVPYDSIMKTK